jgi:hypothetical protein
MLGTLLGQNNTEATPSSYIEGVRGCFPTRPLTAYAADGGSRQFVLQSYAGDCESRGGTGASLS